MPRGGARTGKIGQNYGQRTDLNQAKIPTIVPKGAQYGQRQALEMSQEQLPPAAGNPGQPAPIGGQAPAPGMTGAAPGGPPQAMAGPGGPVALPPFTRPTERPNEPVTHGLPSGPGAGPEAIPMPPNNLAQLLTQLGQQPFASPAIKALASQAQLGRQ